MLLICLAMCLAAWALTVTSQLGVIIDKIESESGNSPKPWRSDQSPEPGEYQHPQMKETALNMKPELHFACRWMTISFCGLGC